MAGVVTVLALVVAGIGAWWVYKVFVRPVEIAVPSGKPVELRDEDAAGEALSEAEIAALLQQAGLNRQAVLGDTGVEGHLARLAAGDVSKPKLVRYARDLEEVRRLTQAHGEAIPSSFWDVDTPAMMKSGWNAYRIVDQLAEDAAEPYVSVMARSFNRFLAFKQAEAGGGDDTALDASLDILLMAHEYITSIPRDRWIQHSDEVQDEAEATLLAWQTLVAGSTRSNPVTGKPVYSHGFVARFNVATMYQYHVGKAMNLSQAWGVSGFAPRFVGTLDNANQVEHMSISALLQGVLDKRLVVLNGIEEEKRLRGKADKAEADADMALNRAVREVFLPLYKRDMKAAVAVLRAVLKGQPQ
jgi:hypothetical protein